MSTPMFDDEGNRIHAGVIDQGERGGPSAMTRTRQLNPWTIAIGVIAVTLFLIGFLLLVVHAVPDDGSDVYTAPPALTLTGAAFIVCSAAFAAAWLASAGVRWSLDHQQEGDGERRRTTG